MSKLSVTVITRNEALDVGEALASVAWADELIVVDSESTDDTVAVTEHGQPFAAIVQHGQVSGVQFHPEKSGDAGLRILRNFVELAR